MPSTDLQVLSLWGVRVFPKEGENSERKVQPRRRVAVEPPKALLQQPIPAFGPGRAGASSRDSRLCFPVHRDRALSGIQRGNSWPWREFVVTLIGGSSPMLVASLPATRRPLHRPPATGLSLRADSL